MTCRSAPAPAMYLNSAPMLSPDDHDTENSNNSNKRKHSNDSNTGDLSANKNSSSSGNTSDGNSSERVQMFRCMHGILSGWDEPPESDISSAKAALRQITL